MIEKFADVLIHDIEHRANEKLAISLKEPRSMMEGTSWVTNQLSKFLKRPDLLHPGSKAPQRIRSLIKRIKGKGAGENILRRAEEMAAQAKVIRDHAPEALSPNVLPTRFSSLMGDAASELSRDVGKVTAKATDAIGESAKKVLTPRVKRTAYQSAAAAMPFIAKLPEYADWVEAAQVTATNPGVQNLFSHIANMLF